MKQITVLVCIKDAFIPISITYDTPLLFPEPNAVYTSLCAYVCVCVGVYVLIKVLYQAVLLMCVFISWMCSFIGELDLS